MEEPTHILIPDDGNAVFVGTKQECLATVDQLDGPGLLWEIQRRVDVKEKDVSIFYCTEGVTLFLMPIGTHLDDLGLVITHDLLRMKRT